MTNYITLKYHERVKSTHTNILGTFYSSFVRPENYVTEPYTDIIRSDTECPIFIMDITTEKQYNAIQSSNLGNNYNIVILELVGSNAPLRAPYTQEMVNKYNTLNNTNFTSVVWSTKFSKSYGVAYRDDLPERYGFCYQESFYIDDFIINSPECVFCVTDRCARLINHYQAFINNKFRFSFNYTTTWVELGYVAQPLGLYTFPLDNRLMNGTQTVDFVADCFPTWLANLYPQKFEDYVNDFPPVLFPRKIKFDLSANGFVGYGTPIEQYFATAFDKILSVGNKEDLIKSEYNYLRYYGKAEYNVDLILNADEQLIEFNITSDRQLFGNTQPIVIDKGYNRGYGLVYDTILPCYRLKVTTFRFVDDVGYVFLGESNTVVESTNEGYLDNKGMYNYLSNMSNVPEYAYTSNRRDTELYAQFYNIITVELIKRHKFTDEEGHIHSPSFPEIPQDYDELVYSSGITVPNNDLSADAMGEVLESHLMYVNTIQMLHSAEFFDYNKATCSTEYESGTMTIGYIYHGLPEQIEPTPQEPQQPINNVTYNINQPTIINNGVVAETMPRDEEVDDTNMLSDVGALFNVYQVAKLDINTLANFLWTDDFLKNIKLVNNNPIENIISLKQSCFNIADTDAVNIQVGNVTSPAMGRPIYRHYHEVIGTFILKGKYNSFLDFSPYTTYYIYLPFVGKQIIDPHLCLNKEVTLHLYVDVTTLVSRYQLTDANGVIICEYEFDAGMDLPISATNNANRVFNILTNAFTTASNIVGGTVTRGVGGAVGGALSGVSGLVSALATQIHTSTNGRPSANTSLLINREVYIEVHRPTYQVNTLYPHTHGYPTNITERVGNLSGFTKFDDKMDLSGIACLSEEKELLKQLLINGIYL